MKQTVLMMVLALGMCSTIALSQTTRECIVEDDGFEWYKTKGTKGSEDVYGAEDRNGNIILPCAFRRIEYDHYDEYSSGLAFGAGFKVWKYPWKSSIERDCVGYYLRNGKCIIPFARSLAGIRKITESLMGTYYQCVKLAERETDNPKKVICDVNGKEIIVFNNIHFEDMVFFRQEKGVFYIQIYSHHLEDGGSGNGLADGNGKLIVAPKSGQPEIVLSKDGRNFGYTDSAGKWISLAPVTSMSTKANPFAKNPKENPDATLLIPTQRPSNTSSSTVSSTTSSSNNNSGNKTTTVVVEHHRDPVPMQQWQACFACGGMGTMGCDNCGGSGTKYIGDRLHRCSRCNGGGIIPCNICFGNKGQYITVYR